MNSLDRLAGRAGASVLFLCLLLFLITVPQARAQNMSTGALNITVEDPSGAVVGGAEITLRDLATNDIHKSVTSGAGVAVIPFLVPSKYSLTVSRKGFSTKVYPSVTVQVNQVTAMVVKMAVGAATQTVTVSANATPLLNTTTNTLSTTVDLREVQDLPIIGRDTFSLAFLVPGAVGNNFDNLPGGAVNTSSNGFSTMTARFKSAGFDDDGSSIENRLEDVQEMTVQTSGLNASHGGTSVMDIGFATKRGTNHYHGLLFEDFRNDAMNANSWFNNFVGLPRPKEIINEFGGSVGGPIIKNKLFFFASLSNFREPLKSTVSTTVATPLALSGVYEYIPQGSSTVVQDNVLQAGASAGCSTCTATVNPVVAKYLANIQSTYSMSGVTLSHVDLNHDALNFLNKGFTVDKYPTLRLDYNITPNLRWTGSVNGTFDYFVNTGAPPYPGPIYADQASSSVERNYQVTTGFDWNLTPMLVNAFRVGYLYTGFLYNTQGVGVPTQQMQEQGDVNFGFSMTSGVNGFNSLRGGSYYPTLGIKDNVSWEHGRHSFVFGGSAQTEVDHYYNNQFVPVFNTYAIAPGDPVANSLVGSLQTNAPSNAAGDVESLYATLNGRVNGYSLGQFVNQKTKEFEPGISFDLHERLTQGALFAMDSWRITPALTLNYGLRWSFTGASTDETGFYTHPDIPNLWGPTPVGAIFQPGALGGVQNPVETPTPQAYAPSYVLPQPNVGVAWNPRGLPDTWLGRFLGNGQTVIRASYSYKNYTEGTQNFWNFGSNGGANFNTTFFTNPVAPGSTPPGPGFYNAGSYVLGNQVPPTLSTSPIPFQPIITEASQTFSGGWIMTFNPHIKQPNVQSWSVGIQRALGPKNVVEVRYVGNVSNNQWVGVNYNEVNIFENGFLKNFQAAQANLAASGGTTFQGGEPTPMFDQAFQATGEQANYTNGQFITWLQQGQAGAFANTLASDPSYLCSMVDATNFSPCAGSGGTGSYPINVFQVNPFAAGGEILEMTNAGYSNYNAMQIDFRQQMWHGMQFDVNYTWSHSLTNNIQGSITPGVYGGGGNNNAGNSAPGFYTLRDKRLNYFPSSFDVPNVLHLSGIYDLPFGRGQRFLNHNRLVNEVVGGWTIGTILSYQNGNPGLFTGGTQTFNTNDGGITLTGVTPRELQSQIRVRHVQGHPFVSLFDPKYIAASGQANASYISPNFKAGTIGQLMWLRAPKWINTDMALTKVFPIRESMSFDLQGEFLNVFNHVAWAGMDTGVQDLTFGTTNGTANGPRNIEVRANFRF